MRDRTVIFTINGMLFEYDDDKNQKNIKKHGISFPVAARVFFDYNRIEMYDEENSIDEDRYDTIGNISAESGIATIGSGVESKDILFVVYTERFTTNSDGKEIDVTRIISARMATNFERGLYYGKHE